MDRRAFIRAVTYGPAVVPLAARVAYIAADFNAPHKEEFDREHMQALFERGYRTAAGDYPWEKTPRRALRW